MAIGDTGAYGIGRGANDTSKKNGTIKLAERVGLRGGEDETFQLQAVKGPQNDVEERYQYMKTEPVYMVEVDDGIVNGTVEVSIDSAFKKDGVSFTATPSDNYVVKSVSVTDEDGEDVPVKEKTSLSTSSDDNGVPLSLMADAKAYSFEMPSSDVTVMAEFAPLRTITFDTNGGTGEMQEVTAAEGSKTKLLPNKLKRDGYTFAGWNTKADGAGTAYADQAEVEVTGDMVLYAQWKKEDPKPATRTITFDANGGTGEMPAMSATEGSKAKLTPSTLERDGYTFAGWNTKENGTGTAYADGAEVEVKGDMVLYAQWKKNATPKAAVRNTTTTTKTLPKTGEADLGAMTALLGAMAAAALLASRAVKE